MANDAHLTALILGLPFFAGGLEPLAKTVIEGRGLVTVPSAPCLRLALQSRAYWEDLQSSAVLVPDSGAMCLFARLRGLTPPVRVSGPALLDCLLAKPEFGGPGTPLFLVNPRAAEAALNRAFLVGLGKDEPIGYTAPLYDTMGEVADEALYQKLRAAAPRHVLINLGGGVQERLGAWLVRRWESDAEASPAPLPTFICTGAAIAFKTGAQGPISRRADRLFLGWAARCQRDPKRYVPRYLKAVPLLSGILRFGRKSPHP